MNTLSKITQKNNKAAGFARGIATAVLIAASLVARADDNEEAKKAAEKAAQEAAAKAAEYEKSKESESSGKESEGSKGSESGKVSNIQSEARPYGLQIAGPVMVGGSDERSKAFQTEALPKLAEFVNAKLGESHKLDDSSFLLDPSKLKLENDADLRVYFVGEGAGYHNTLGYVADGGDIKGAKIIFPDASSPIPSYKEGQEEGVKRTEKEPLLAGDFVNLGQFHGGTKLDFFIVADGANGGKEIFSTEKSQNRDGINHVISFVGLYSSYLLLSFEDLYGGGDRDFNDVIFAVDIGKANVAALTATPEPGTWLTLGSFLGAGVWFAKRRKKA